MFISDQIRQLFGEGVKVEYPSDPLHGDYATAYALELAKKEKKNPREVAEKILKSLKTPPWILKTEIAGPGFINFFLAPDFLTDFLDEIIKEGKKFGKSAAHHGQTVITDTSHPNIAKPMGAHHLLSTIIGNSLNNIFAAAGFHVIRDNYMGDWGTQFGKLIYAYKKWGDEAQVNKNPIPELLKLYVKFHDKAEKDPKLEEAGRAEFKKLEQGDAS